MSIFRFRWLRRLIRRNTKPIPEEMASLWKERLSFAYMIIAWNALGGILYLTFTGKYDLAEYYGLKREDELNKIPALYFADLLGIKKAHIITVKHFKKTDDFYYENNDQRE